MNDAERPVDARVSGCMCCLLNKHVNVVAVMRARIETGGIQSYASPTWERLVPAKVVELFDQGCFFKCSQSTVLRHCPHRDKGYQQLSSAVWRFRLKPWLIEVNASPSMARENLVDRQVIHQDAAREMPCQHVPGRRRPEKSYAWTSFTNKIGFDRLRSRYPILSK